MPKPEKKLKAVVKSHFSHEIRKDVDLTQLNSLKLDQAWPFIKEEIEREIGSDGLVCVPYLEEASLYQVSSVFVRRDMQLQPAGKLADLLDEAKSHPDYVEWQRSESFVDEDFKFPHESVKITLQDEQAKNKVRVIMMNLSRHKFPKDKSPVKNIYLSADKGLKGVKSVYMITDVLMAKTVEFRANTGISSRIFHLGNPTPLVFGLEQFDVSEDGQLISRIPVSDQSKTVWSKAGSHDHLLTPSKTKLATS
ncbi:uncharacterized protein LOC143913382 [Arctopsyche grandis]|uniref:uncharacterized protein LOC143913382 n=1 Tax=Arctopsyche grandis TaxID=121162 RepID=UPI00406D867F